MSKILVEQDIRELLYGATFLGAGGGGSLGDGMTMLDDNVRMRDKVEVTLMDPAEMAEGSHAVMIAGMGAPTILQQKEEKFRFEAGYALDAIVDVSYYAGKKISAVIPVEYGAVNCMVPIIACLERGLPLVDADGCGRAVPGLDTTMFDIGGIPFAPGIISSEKGDIITVFPDDPRDGAAAENMCRYLCAVYGYIMGLGGWVSSKADVNEKLITGSLSFAQKVGKAILAAKAAGTSVEDALAEVTPMRKLTEGRVVKQENVMKAGHDIGCTTVEDESGKKFFIDIKNESIVFRSEEKVIMTCPDLICAVNLDTYAPLTNADIKEDMRIAYFAIPAPALWFASQKATDSWKPYFEAVGYNGDVVRF